MSLPTLPVAGSLVKFVYLLTGKYPAPPVDENTIYFSPEGQKIFVGDVIIVDGEAINNRIDNVEAEVSDVAATVDTLNTEVDTLNTETIPDINDRISEIVTHQVTWDVIE